MAEEGDPDDKPEDKATNEAADNVKKVATEGADKEKKQVAMKVANTNCLDDLIADTLLLTPSLVGRQCWGKTILPGALGNLNLPRLLIGHHILRGLRVLLECGPFRSS